MFTPPCQTDSIMSRKQHVPWRAAGTASEAQASADDVVRETGWVFNNVIGDDANLAEFVSSGDHEVGSFMKAFDLPHGIGTSIVEIGSGIGEATAALAAIGPAGADKLEPPAPRAGGLLVLTRQQ